MLKELGEFTADLRFLNIILFGAIVGFSLSVGIDDVTDVAPIHLGGGMVGIISAAFFTTRPFYKIAGYCNYNISALFEIDNNLALFITYDQS